MGRGGQVETVGLGQLSRLGRSVSQVGSDRLGWVCQVGLVRLGQSVRSIALFMMTVTFMVDKIIDVDKKPTKLPFHPSSK